MNALVTTEWLAEHLGVDDLRIVDTTYASPAAGSAPHDPAAAFAASHIPGAVFMDLTSLVDEASPFPSMLPEAAAFAERMAALGIANDSHVVLYDSSPHHTSARAWWMLRSFGAGAVSILDGGFHKWAAERRATERGDPAPPSATFRAELDARAVRTLDQMKANLSGGAEQVLDARSRPRFSGAKDDPRPGVTAGHIPGSRNLPYTELFDADGSWKRGAALRAAFEAAGIDLTRPVVTTCGSGITAAVLAFGAHLLGAQAALYDGSWSEWGADPTTPKAMGEA